MPSKLAEGLNLLQQPLNGRDDVEIQILSIKDEFGKGAKDEEWIPMIGANSGIVITQDFRIQTLKHQRELYQRHGVSIFFVSPPSKSGFTYWEMVKLIIDRWDEIRKILRKNKPPFAFRCTSRTKFEPLK